MAKKEEYYMVIAHRWSNPENHSYPVGIFDNKSKAIKVAEQEADERGGKYNCWVYQFPLNGYDTFLNVVGKIIYKTTNTIQ